MASTSSIDVLNRLLHDTVNSVVQYADISAPHVPKGMDEQAIDMQNIAGEEKALATEIANLVIKCDGVPTVGVFDYWNVDLNYLDLRFMAHFAVQHQDKAIARLEGEMDGVKDDPEVHAFLKKALAQKKDHRERLTAVAGDYAAS